MLRLRKNEITVCTNHEGFLCIRELSKKELKECGVARYNYSEPKNDRIWYTFTTRLNAREVAEIFNKKFYKSYSKIIGNTILLTFKDEA